MDDGSGFGRTVEPEPIHRGPSIGYPDLHWTLLAERIQHLRELILRELAALEVAKKLQADVYEQRLMGLNGAHAAAKEARLEQVSRVQFDASRMSLEKEIREINDRLLRMETKLEAERANMESKLEAERANMVKWIAIIGVVVTLINIVLRFL